MIRAIKRALAGPSRPLAGRRKFVLNAATGIAILSLPACAPNTGEPEMYGLIGKVKTVPGRRDDLISILLEGVSGMPGCLSYVVARDPADADAVWITEVWDSQSSHEGSLSLPSVRDAISRGRPLIAGFDSHIETVPVGGHGIALSNR